MIQFTINPYLASFYQLWARKQNNCLEKEPKENSAGYGRCLKLSGIRHLANPHLRLYLGQGFFWPRQHRCQGLADAAMVLPHYLSTFRSNILRLTSLRSIALAGDVSWSPPDSRVV